MTAPVSVVMRRGALLAKTRDINAARMLAEIPPTPRDTLRCCLWCGSTKTAPGISACWQHAGVEALWQEHLSADAGRMSA